jgi:hypothetical protein
MDRWMQIPVYVGSQIAFGLLDYAKVLFKCATDARHRQQQPIHHDRGCL